MAKYGNIVRVPGVDPTLAQSIFAEGAGDSQMLAEALRGATQEDIAETQAEAATRQALISSETQKDVAEARNERARLKTDAQLQMAQQEMQQRQREAEIKQGIAQDQLDAKRELAEARRAAKNARFNKAIDIQEKYNKRYMDAKEKFREQQRKSKLMQTYINLKGLKHSMVQDDKQLKLFRDLVKAAQERKRTKRVEKKKVEQAREKVNKSLGPEVKAALSNLSTKIGRQGEKNEGGFISKATPVGVLKDSVNQIVKQQTGKTVDDIIANPDDATQRDLLVVQESIRVARTGIKNQDVPWYWDVERLTRSIYGGKTPRQARDEEFIKALDAWKLDIDTAMAEVGQDKREKLQEAEDTIEEKPAGSFNDKLLEITGGVEGLANKDPDDSLDKLMRWLKGEITKGSSAYPEEMFNF